MIVDFTQLINEKISAYSEDEMPKIMQIANINNDFYEERKLEIFTHTGTHVDSPRHVLNEGRYLDEYDLEELQGKTIVLDFTNFVGENIELKDVVKFSKEIEEVEFVLINTGWSKYFGSGKYLNRYPVLSKEASVFISEGKNIKGIGVDCISVDGYNEALTNHYVFLKKGIVIIENLTNLHKVKGIFNLVVAPLYIENSDGAPARVFAIKE